MRKSWIAVGVAVLAAGLAAGYRLGRVDVSPGPASSAAHPSGVPGASPGRAGAPGAKPEAGSPPAGTAPAGSAVVGSNGSAPAGETASTPIKLHHMEESSQPLGVSHVDSWTGAASPKGPPPEGGAPPGAAHAPGAGAPASAASRPVVPPLPPSGNPAKTPGTSAADPSKAAPSPAPTDDPNSDRHPPVLQYLRFDPPEIQDGTVTVLSVGATDDLSGVKSVFGTVRSPSQAAVIPFVGQDVGGSGVFSASISIPKKAETGDWFVGTLQIVDRADNPLNVSFVKGSVPAGGSVRVVSADSDSTAPSVHRVYLDKPSVAGGEKNQVEVEVDDGDGSGVASVTGTFQSPSKAAFIPFSCTATGDGRWMGILAVPTSADCGQWTLRLLRVADKANNTAVLMADSPQVAGVGFMVSGGGGCDSDPPVLDSLYVAPGSVSNAVPSEVVITITAHDDGSGVGSLTGRVEGPAAANGQVPRIFFSTQPDPRNPDAPMIAKITVPQFAATGLWRVAVIELTDKAHNTRPYYATDPALANATFTVQ